MTTPEHNTMTIERRVTIDRVQGGYIMTWRPQSNVGILDTTREVFTEFDKVAARALQVLHDLGDGEVNVVYHQIRSEEPDGVHAAPHPPDFEDGPLVNVSDYEMRCKSCGVHPHRLCPSPPWKKPHWHCSKCGGITEPEEPSHTPLGWDGYLRDIISSTSGNSEKVDDPVQSLDEVYRDRHCARCGTIRHRIVCPPPGPPMWQCTVCFSTHGLFETGPEDQGNLGEKRSASALRERLGFKKRSPESGADNLADSVEDLEAHELPRRRKITLGEARGIALRAMEAANERWRHVVEELDRIEATMSKVEVEAGRGD